MSELTTEAAVRAVLLPHKASSPMDHLRETLSYYLHEQRYKYRVVAQGAKPRDRMEHLKETSPEAYELVQQLPPEYQKTVTLFFPIHGEEAFVGVEINGKGMQPADPTSYAVCNRLLEMLREENPQYLQWGMEQARKQRHQYPEGMPDDNPENLIDGKVLQK